MNKSQIFRRVRDAADVTLRLAGGGILIAGLAACHDEKPVSSPAVVVALPAHAEQAAATRLRFPAEAAARYSNPMSFRVAGKVVERKFRIGDAVRKGEIVARLDAADAEKRLAGAEAALAAAEHRLVYAKQQLDRDNAQAAQSLIADSQLELTQDAYVSAKAARDEAAAQCAIARDALDYHVLTADHDGVIVSENADTGQVVAAGQPVYGLAWSGDIDAVLDVGASDVGQVAVGQKADVEFLSLPGHPIEAKVREIAGAADPLSRTFRVKLSLSEPPAALRLGMTGYASLSAASAVEAGPTFRLPATAIFHAADMPAIFVVAADQTLELRHVALAGMSAGGATVTGDLKEGELVVQAGVHTVHAGEAVNPVRPLYDSDGDFVVRAQAKPRSE